MKSATLAIAIALAVTAYDIALANPADAALEAHDHAIFAPVKELIRIEIERRSLIEAVLDAHDHVIFAPVKEVVK